MLTTKIRVASDVENPDAGWASMFVDAGVVTVKLSN